MLLTESVTKVRAMGTMRSFIMAIHENIHEGCSVKPKLHLFLFRNSTEIRSLFTHPRIPFLQHVSSSQSALPSLIIKFLTSLKMSTTTTKRPVRRIRKRRQTPAEYVPPPELLNIISQTLPADYEFEIPKTIWRIQTLKARHVCLQMPEGLLMYATSIGDILKRFSSPSTEDGDSNSDGGLIVSVLGDVTYGACCIGDLDAKALGCDLLVHYGHSCLVPMTTTAVPCLYVFVEIRIDVRHFVECVVASVPVGTRCELMGTIQFRSAVAEAAKLLNSDSEMYGGARPCRIPQAKPLSPGEVLGCTAPTIVESDDSNVETVLLFIADGRFHLEAAMIANPKLRALRYDPYSKVLTEEGYDHMKRLRLVAIKQAARENVKAFGIILGTLGRQGDPAILSNIFVRNLNARGLSKKIADVTSSGCLGTSRLSKVEHRLGTLF